MELGSILLAALGIGLLIFMHESGHFMAARAAGVHVEEFSIGFGPRLFGCRWRGTDFRFCAVPFGGYVRVAGQDPLDQRYPPEQSLYSKSVGRRAVFWSGGVLMNVLFALLVFPLVFRAGVQFEAPVAGPVAPGTALWEARIEAGERIVAVGSRPVYSLNNLIMEVALNGNRSAELLVESADGSRRTVTTQPHFNRETGLYELGISRTTSDAPAPLQVAPGGVADRAGLRTGDLLVAVADQPPVAFYSLTGSAPVRFRVRSDGVEREVELTPRMDAPALPPRIGVRPLPRRIGAIRQGSPLVERLGLQRDDLLLAVDGKPFLSGELAAALAGDGPTRWLVQRDGREIELGSPQASAEERQQLTECVALTADLSLQLWPQPDSPAARAGLLAGDTVLAVNGVELAAWDDLRKAVEGAGTTPLLLRLHRPSPDSMPTSADAAEGTVVELRLTPERDPEFGCEPQLSRITTEIRAESISEAMQLGVTCSIDLVKQLYVTLKRLLTGEVGANNLSGIIGISRVSYDAAQRGPSWFWYLMAMLSVNLAFVNLLPIPVLDGGHLLFLLIEKVKGSPVSPRVFGYSQVVGLVFVLLLVLFVTYNDILRLL